MHHVDVAPASCRVRVCPKPSVSSSFVPDEVQKIGGRSLGVSQTVCVDTPVG